MRIETRSKTRLYVEYLRIVGDRLMAVGLSGNIFTFAENRSILNKMTFDGNHLWDRERTPA